MHPRQAAMLTQAEKLTENLAGKEAGSPVLWRYVDGDSGQEFFLTVRLPNVHSPFSGKSVPQRPDKFQLPAVQKELREVEAPGAMPLFHEAQRALLAQADNLLEKLGSDGQQGAITRPTPLATDQQAVAPPEWEGTVKEMKKHDEIDNPWALAWSMKNKGDKPHHASTDHAGRLMARQEAILKKHVESSGHVDMYDDLPKEVQSALQRVKDQETLESDVTRWLGDHRPKTASLIEQADQLMEKLAAAAILWKYVDEDGQEFFLPSRRQNVHSPYTGKSTPQRPEKFQMSDVSKELRDTGKGAPGAPGPKSGAPKAKPKGKKRAAEDIDWKVAADGPEEQKVAMWGGRGGEVIPSRRWKHKDTGATASLYGAVPWSGGPGDRKEDWELESVGWTIRWDDGTIGIGRVPWKSKGEAEEWLKKEEERIRG